MFFFYNGVPMQATGWSTALQHTHTQCAGGVSVGKRKAAGTQLICLEGFTGKCGIHDPAFMQYRPSTACLPASAALRERKRERRADVVSVIEEGTVR